MSYAEPVTRARKIPVCKNSRETTDGPFRAGGTRHSAAGSGKLGRAVEMITKRTTSKMRNPARISMRGFNDGSQIGCFKKKKISHTDEPIRGKCRRGVSAPLKL